MESIAEERDSTLQEAQDLADRLQKAEEMRDVFRGSLESAQGQVEELQLQLHDLNKRLGHLVA